MAARHRAAPSSARARALGVEAQRRAAPPGGDRHRGRLRRRAAPAPRRGAAKRGERAAAARRASAQREWWSSSTLVTTAISGAARGSCRRTRRPRRPPTRPLPSPRSPARRRRRRPGSSPPRKKPGSAPSARSAWTSIPAVVVLPWVPATAIRRRSAQSSASSSPRWITRWPRSRARASSGLSSAIARRDDDLGARRDALGVVADPRLEPGGAQPLQVGALGAVAAGHRGAELVADERQAAHPGAADRDEVQLARRSSRRSSMHRKACADRARAAPSATRVGGVGAGERARRPRPSARAGPDRRAARRRARASRAGVELGVLDHDRRPAVAPSTRRWRAGGARTRADTGRGSRAGRAAAISKIEPPARASTRSEAASASARPGSYSSSV